MRQQETQALSLRILFRLKIDNSTSAAELFVKHREKFETTLSNQKSQIHIVLHSLKNNLTHTRLSEYQGNYHSINHNYLKTQTALVLYQGKAVCKSN